ncbi:hypothetical protein HAX54_048356, partial [Datura stramonium]|nr:hypothetical protein [Datura stramonium]
MIISYSPVGCGETLIEHRFKLQLASSHYFDPAFHQRFAEQDRRISTNPIYYISPAVREYSSAAR